MTSIGGGSAIPCYYSRFGHLVQIFFSFSLRAFDKFQSRHRIQWHKSGVRQTEETLYLDIYLFINFALDVLCLYFTGCVFCLAMHAGKLALGAALGSAFALLCTLFPGNRAVTALIAVGMSALMCEIAFAPTNRRQRMRLLLFFYIFSALFAGMVSCLYALLPQLLLAFAPRTPSRGRMLFALCICLCCLALFFALRAFRMRSGEKRIDVTVIVAGAAVRLHCFADSGNLLTEPFSGLPVILCAERKFSAYEAQTARRLRLIPASGVGGHTLLRGFLPDSVIVCNRKHGEKKQAVVAFSDAPFPVECDGIVPTGLL